MKGPMITPCAEWAVLLAANPAELTSAERRTLDDHLAGCQACRNIQTDYALQDVFLHQQPVPAPREGLPPLLLAAWAAEEGQERPAARVNDPVPLPARGDWRRSRRLSGLLGTVAAVLVGAVLVTALAVSRLPAGAHPQPTAQRTHPLGMLTPTATPAPDGTWVPVPALSQLSSEPIIAPATPTSSTRYSIENIRGPRSP